MTKEHLFSTDLILSTTSLKKSSVQRYIKNFHEFFSPSAILPDRRRRFTGADVKTLLLIKYLYAIRESKAEIIKSLRGEKIVPAVSWLEISQALDIALTADRAMKECENIYRNMKIDLHLHKCFVQDQKREFRRTAAIVNAELHGSKQRLVMLEAKQNADARMMFENIRALGEGNGLNDRQKRNAKQIIRILQHEQQEKILNDRQRKVSDEIIKNREAQLEEVTSRKKENRFAKSMDAVAWSLYKLTLPADERLEINAREAREKWEAEHEAELDE